MPLDIEKYMPFTDGFDMSREDKEELLRTVWGILESQADQAFGLHPVQACGKHSKRLSHDSMRGVDSEGTKRQRHFNRESLRD